MREIKYRAWDKINNQLAELSGVVFENGEIISISTEFMDHGDHPELHAAPLDSVVLMQYTGLKDKNGVEIYEGDIVRIIDDGETDIGWGWNEEVIFHNGAFMAGDDNLLVNINFRCLVIGNIYENSELLEAEK